MIIEKRVNGNIKTNTQILSVKTSSGEFKLAGSVKANASFKSNVEWGDIDGNLEDQEDLWVVLDNKLEEDDIKTLSNIEIERLLK